MIWTYSEFDARLQDRTDALHRRNTQLMCWFGALLGLGLLSTAVISTVSARLALGGALASLVGIGGLAVYVIASTRSYSRRHRVTCGNCDTSLLKIAEQIDAVIENGASLPRLIRCPGCGFVVIALDA